MVRVLIVDDEPAILTSTASLLEDLGFEVHTIGDHSEVVGALQRFAPDIVLQDVRMPGLDLSVLLAKARALRPHARIVLFSAGMDLRDLAETHRPDGWLEKPFKPQELLRAIAPAEA